MHRDPDEFDLPHDLATALRSAYAHEVAIPPATDAAIMAAAREKFDRRRRMRLLARWGGGAAAAAAIAASVVLAVMLHRPPQTGTMTSPAIASRGDVNGDGHVNMVDAMLLAKHVRNGDAAQQAWDVNGDGAIDARDAEAIAAAAVNLKQGGIAGRGLPRMRDLGIGRNPARLAVGLASAGAANGNPRDLALAAPPINSNAPKTSSEVRR
jgi:hypothetical protein